MGDEGSQYGTCGSVSGHRCVCVSDLIPQNSKATLNFSASGDEETVSRKPLTKMNVNVAALRFHRHDLHLR